MSNIYIIDNHDEALAVWRKKQIQDAVLVHIDAHIDYVPLEDCKYINIGNYLTYALLENIFSHIYWVIPGKYEDNEIYTKHIIANLPMCFEVIEIQHGIIKLKNVEIYGRDLTIITLNDFSFLNDELKEKKEVCVDIDIDFMMNPLITKNYSYGYPSKLWISTEELYHKLSFLVKKSFAVTIARSLIGGYSPLLCAYLPEYLCCLFLNKGGRELKKFKHIERGCTLLSEGNYSGALRYYKKIDGSFFTFLSILIGELYACVLEGDVVGAKRLYENLEERYMRYEPYFFPVSVALINGQYDLSKKMIELWMTVSELSEQANLYYMKYINKTCPSEMEKYKERIGRVTDINTCFEKSYILGDIFLKTNRYKEAIQCFDSVLLYLQKNETPTWVGQISSFEVKKNHGIIIADIYEKLMNAYMLVNDYTRAKKYAMMCKKIGYLNKSAEYLLKMI